MIRPGEDITGFLVFDDSSDASGVADGDSSGGYQCFQAFISLKCSERGESPNKQKMVVVSTWSGVVLGLETISFELAGPPHPRSDDRRAQWSLDFEFGLVPTVKKQRLVGQEYWQAPVKTRHKVVKWSTPIDVVV